MTRGELVTVTLDPPRLVSSTESAWWLSAADCETTRLPKMYVHVELADGKTIDTVTIPRWLAEDRGLLPVEEHADNQSSEHEPITRHDWYAGLAMLGMLMRGSNTSSIPWDARKLADRMLE